MTLSSKTDDSNLAPASATLSRDQAEELEEVLQEPLSGRSVMMPLGPYAFVRGQLKPTVQESGEELVEIQGKHFTREEARKWLMASLPACASETSSSTKQHPSQPSPSRSSSHAVPAMPLVDIHEEYDAHGNPLSADVVDMNQRLQSLWNLGTDEDPSGETKMDPNTNWMDTILQSKTDTPSGDNETIIDDDAPLKPLDDQEYDRLSRRLEQLAMLEEQQASLKSGNGGGHPSPLRSKGSGTVRGGWKKGFLNSQQKAIKKKKAPPSPVENKKATSTTVKIDTSQNQVQEIPRIGTQKVPPKQGAVTAPLKMERPLEEAIFSGVIQERPLSNPLGERQSSSVVAPSTNKKTSRFAASHEAVTISSTKSSDQQEPKRLSRFAQERQGL